MIQTMIRSQTNEEVVVRRRRTQIRGPKAQIRLIQVVIQNEMMRW